MIIVQFDDVKKKSLISLKTKRSSRFSVQVYPLDVRVIMVKCLEEKNIRTT